MIRINKLTKFYFFGTYVEVDIYMDSVLVVAAWGFAPSWRWYKYVVGVDHRAFRDLQFEGESCSSTLVIASYLRSLGRDSTAIIFGLDSVADPNKDADVRKSATELYRTWLEKLIEMCSVCNNIDISMFDIVVLPAIGNYYGYKFCGSIAHLFNKAFVYMTKELSKRKYNFMFLDLTHGVNYQLISVLYAAIASSIIGGMENRIIMLNSEPTIGGGQQRCIEFHTKEVPSNLLRILDVTELQQTINFIRVLYSVKSFAIKPLEITLGDVSKVDEYSKKITEFLRSKLIPFFKLLGNAIFGPTYSGAYITKNNISIEPLEMDICKHFDKLTEVELKDVEYTPVVESTNKVVKYPPTSVHIAIAEALRLFVQNVCSVLKSEDFIDYVDKVSQYLEKEGNLHGYMIAEEVKETLGAIAKYVYVHRDTLPQNYIRVESDGSIAVAAVLFRALNEKKYDVINSIRQNKNLILEDILKNIENVHSREVEKLMRKERADVRTIRNMVAHGGLGYVTLKEIVIKDGKIMKIVYDEKLLQKILDETLR